MIYFIIIFVLDEYLLLFKIKVHVQKHKKLIEVIIALKHAIIIN